MLHSIPGISRDVVFQILDFPCGNAADKRIIRHISGHNSAGDNDNIVANRYARQDRHIAAEPDIVADVNGLCDPQVLAPSHRGKRMPHRGDQRVGADHDIVANIDLPKVEDGKVVIAGKIISDKNLFAIVAAKRLVDPDFFANTAQHGF